jgi:hypothetical protein
MQNALLYPWCGAWTLVVWRLCPEDSVLRVISTGLENIGGEKTRSVIGAKAAFGRSR